MSVVTGMPATTQSDATSRQGNLRPIDGLIVQKLDAEVVILDQYAGRVHQFHHTDAIVWCGLWEGKSLDEITATIAGRYDLPDFRARKDANRMIEHLKALKLLTDRGTG